MAKKTKHEASNRLAFKLPMSSCLSGKSIAILSVGICTPGPPKPSSTNPVVITAAVAFAE